MYNLCEHPDIRAARRTGYPKPSIAVSTEITDDMCYKYAEEERYAFFDWLMEQYPEEHKAFVREFAEDWGGDSFRQYCKYNYPGVH